MTGNEILQSDLLDIVFDKRNKQYGAYELRRNYNSRVLAALVITISSTFLIYLLIDSGPAKKLPVMQPAKEVVVRDFDIRKEEIIIPRQEVRAAPSQSAAQRKFISNIQIRQQVDVNNLLPRHDALENVAISDLSRKGPLLNGPVGPPGIGKPGGSGLQIPVDGNTEKPLPDMEPEFPGGKQAWNNFLGKHLRVPPELEVGDKKTVIIRFMVSSEGTVTNFEIIHSGGKAFDDEVIRVLKKMPSWKPARRNGLHVSTTFSQPVTFMAVEE